MASDLATSEKGTQEAGTSRSFRAKRVAPSARVDNFVGRKVNVNPPRVKGDDPERPKGTQRDRLVSGMVAAANEYGYAKANVSEIIAAAKVSRPTFYECFADKDHCFRLAVEEGNAKLLDTVRRALAEEPPERALPASARAVVEFSSDEPALARFLLNEPLGAGAFALNVRDEGIVAIDRLVQARLRGADRSAAAADFSARAIIGGIYRALGPRLRRSEPKIAALLPDLQYWLAAYEEPIASHEWRQLKLGPKQPLSPFVPSGTLKPPAPFPRGRLRLGEEEIAENQRLRIMFAAAELAHDKGYNATTMADITKRAGVDGRAFYTMFTDKRDAFMAVHEFGSQHVMQVTADAFFSGENWPERNWEAGCAFTQFLEANPLVANVGFVEAYAVGPGAIQRVEDSHGAFGMLLREGYRHVPAERQPPQVIPELVVTTIFEMVYNLVRAGRASRLSGLVPSFTFLVLAPFLGADQANEFIARKLDI